MIILCDMFTKYVTSFCNDENCVYCKDLLTEWAIIPCNCLTKMRFLCDLLTKFAMLVHDSSMKFASNSCICLTKIPIFLRDIMTKYAINFWNCLTKTAIYLRYLLMNLAINFCICLTKIPFFYATSLRKSWSISAVIWRKLWFFTRHIQEVCNFMPR